jgi:DNA-binding PadR family transcriptional regulator
MARQSQTSTAILGVLSIEPLTGYEIRQAIAAVLGHFWHESFGQIYPCLADLERDSLVRSHPGERPRSSVFEITTAGRTRLRELLREPVAPQPPRNGVLLRTFFGTSLAREDLAGMLDDVEIKAGERSAAFARLRAVITAEPAYPQHGAYWEATIRAGELANAAQLQWVEETRAALLPPATLPAS